ncbi:MAG: sigma-70 family RNA polymerase sigma factor [Phycisphaerae bacterium]
MPENNERSVPATETWVANYGDMLFRYVRLRVRDDATAEELVQETFLAALQGLKNFSGQSSFGTWLVGILKHKLIDHLRRQVRETPAAMDDDGAVSGMFNSFGHWTSMATPHAWKSSPEELAQQADTQRALKTCMEALPRRYREVFVMRVMDGVETEEMCKILELNPNNLYMMLHRARLRLRACLESKGIGRD